MWAPHHGGVSCPALASFDHMSLGSAWRLHGGLIYKLGRSVVPGGTSSGAKTVLRRMEAFMGSNDPMMPQPRFHSQLAEDKTTHTYASQE